MKNSNSIDKWFKYMLKFDDDLCMQKMDMKLCSEEIIQQITKVEPISTKVTQAMSTAAKQNQSLVENFVTSAEKFDILFYPEVSINNRNLYGLFRAPDIFEMICSSLQTPPKECHSFLKNDKKQTFGEDVSNGLWKTVLLIILAMVVFFFIALFGYNQIIRRQMNREMSMEVNKMVEHYVAMTEEKSKSNAAMD